MEVQRTNSRGYKIVSTVHPQGWGGNFLKWGAIATLISGGTFAGTKLLNKFSDMKGLGGLSARDRLLAASLGTSLPILVAEQVTSVWVRKQERKSAGSADDLQATIDTLRQELAEAQARAREEGGADHDQTIAQLQQRVAELEGTSADVEEMQGEIARLRQDVARREQDRVRLQDQHREMVANLKAEISALSTGEEDGDAESKAQLLELLRGAREVNDKSTELLEQNEEEISRLKKQLAEVTQRFEAKVVGLEQQLDEATRVKAEQTSKLNEEEKAAPNRSVSEELKDLVEDLDCGAEEKSVHGEGAEQAEDLVAFTVPEPDQDFPDEPWRKEAHLAAWREMNKVYNNFSEVIQLAVNKARERSPTQDLQGILSDFDNLQNCLKEAAKELNINLEARSGGVVNNQSRIEYVIEFLRDPETIYSIYERDAKRKSESSRKTGRRTGSRIISSSRSRRRRSDGTMRRGGREKFSKFQSADLAALEKKEKEGVKLTDKEKRRLAFLRSKSKSTGR